VPPRHDVVRVACCAPRPTPAVLGVSARSPPDVPLRPRPTASPGYAPAKAAHARRRAGVSTAPRVGAPRAPCRPDAPPFGPAVHPLRPARVRLTTAGHHTTFTPGRPAPYLNTAIPPSARQPSRRPPLPPPPVSSQLRSLPSPAGHPTLSPRTRRTSQSRILSSERFSSPEPLRTMCGSRTGGWSLPCVMST
jgi:hypothetical protein